jgi:hypothetical protein
MRSGSNGFARAAAAVAAALALGGVATGCGDDDSGSGGKAAAPSKLAMKASGSGKTPKFEVPASVTGGLVTIEFTNDAKGGEVDGQLARIEGDHSEEEVRKQFANAVSSKPVEDWFIAAGGAGATKPGKTSTVTQVLEPGTYYVLSGDKPPKGALPKFEVKAGEGGELPEGDGTVTASEYKFEGTGLKAGKIKLQLRNEGKQWHHFLAAPLKPNATVDQVKKFFKDEKGPPPFAGEENGVSSAVMNGGISQVVNVDLKPGKYAFFCFVSDREGGPPHAMKGMVSEVTVE